MEVKDIGAYILYSDGRVFKKKWGKFMTGSPNSDGYILISINSKLVKLHTLIIEAFKDKPISEKRLQVNHKNGIKTDNRIENLEWCTQSENILHAFRTGLNKPHLGSKNGWSKLNEDNVREIKKKILSKQTQTSIAKEYNVTVQCINLIKRGKNWGHIII